MHGPFIRPEYHTTILLRLCYVERTTLKILFIHIVLVSGLDSEIQTSATLVKFKARIMSFIKVDQCFTIHDPIGIRLLAKLSLDFSQLNKQKFRC